MSISHNGALNLDLAAHVIPRFLLAMKTLAVDALYAALNVAELTHCLILLNGCRGMDMNKSNCVSCTRLNSFYRSAFSSLDI